MNLCEIADLCDAIDCDGYRFEAQYGDIRALPDKLILSDGNERYEFPNYDVTIKDQQDNDLQIFDLRGQQRTLVFLQIDVKPMPFGLLSDLHAQRKSLEGKGYWP